MSNEQNKLELQETEDTKVDGYKFAPIKGYPMLNWRGKRPFTSTQFYPAQLKETYGEEVDGWRNKIFWGDNLQVMGHMLKKFRGKVDLIYIDPPFDSKADYKKKISLRGTVAKNDHLSFEDKQYSDLWSNDQYLQFIYERIVLCKELLSNTGSIYLHCDYHKSHHLRCILDEVFGTSVFQNDIQWCYNVGGKGKTRWARKHDTIFFYTKTSDWFFDGKAVGIVRDTGSKSSGGIMGTDENGRPYQDKLVKSSGKYYRYYLDEPKVPEDWWADINTIQSGALERTNYPTQKPEALLTRIIKASCPENGIVFDCFMGSGTTQAVAMKTGRKFIGADINLGAIQTATTRFIGILNEVETSLDLNENAASNTGFEVYNVNNYDVFRNPIQAKELLVEALEIQPLLSSSIYDGEKDGRMVKIMPVNRIATKADLEGLVSGFDYKSLQKRQNENPNKAVEKLLLVCMGHEPDLGAQLQHMVGQFKLDVEVVDILRDKSEIEFKRDSQAELSIKDGKLRIEKFYPMSLLQKLSLQKETVGEWRELVDSIMVDWNYDGVIFQPTVLDVPEKNELVSGTYEVPNSAGTVHVKITDLLSESWEGSSDA